MAEYILQILRSQLMEVFSWGFHKPRHLPNDRGISFMVEGYKYQGKVQVIYNEGTDLFEVHLENGRIEEDVYLDQLVGVIDSLVERCENYDEQVKKHFQDYFFSA